MTFHYLLIIIMLLLIASNQQFSSERENAMRLKVKPQLTTRISVTIRVIIYKSPEHEHPESDSTCLTLPGRAAPKHSSQNLMFL